MTLFFVYICLFNSVICLFALLDTYFEKKIVVLSTDNISIFFTYDLCIGCNSTVSNLSINVHS